MRGLTICQPYATLVAAGAKTIETRSWQTDYRGPLLVHAGKNLGPVGGMTGFLQLCARPPFTTALRACGHPEGGRSLPRGAVLAIASLDEVMPAADAAGYRFVTPTERSFGDFTPGRYAWLLSLVAVFDEPVEAAGRLGLWTAGDELLRALGGRSVRVPGLRL